MRLAPVTSTLDGTIARDHAHQTLGFLGRLARHTDRTHCNLQLGRSKRGGKARAFCNRFPVGSSLADVATAARDAGDARHRRIREGDISVAYIGVPPFSRHVCAFAGESGKVTEAWYVYID